MGVLSGACGLVELAHPFRYPDPAIELERCSDPRIGAVERWYPYGCEVDPRPIERAIDRYDLVPTGGSDAHDDVLGRVSTGRRTGGSGTR